MNLNQWIAIDQSYKFHSASDKYPTMQHFVYPDWSRLGTMKRVNLSHPGLNGCDFTDDSFKRIFIENILFRFKFHWSLSKGSNWQQDSIGLGNGLEPDRQQVNILAKHLTWYKKWTGWFPHMTSNVSRFIAKLYIFHNDIDVAFQHPCFDKFHWGMCELLLNYIYRFVTISLQPI